MTGASASNRAAPSEASASGTPELATLRLKVGGMSCSFCVETIRKAYARTEGVAEAHVSLAHDEALVRYHPNVVNADALRETLRELGYSVRDPDKVRAFEERQAEIRTARRRLAVAGSLTLASALLMVLRWLAGGLAQTLEPLMLGVMPALAAATVVGPGRYILVKAYHSLRRGILNQHVLLELGAFAGLLGGALGFLGRFAGMPGLAFPIPDFFAVAVFITTYHVLSEVTSLEVRVRASRSVERLLDLRPDTALRVAEDGTLSEVGVDELALGERVRVRPGNAIPVDGTIVEGASAVDESLVSGEPMAVDKVPGDSVVGGSVNGNGSLLVRVDMVGEDTFLRRVARSVEEARAQKPGILQLTDRVLTYYVPAVVAFAALALLLWTLGAWLVAGHPEPARGVFAALAVLVLGYPCALGMAAPLAMIRGGGMAAERGILMRSGEAYSILKDVTVIALDKTGTLTHGRPTLTDVVPAPGASVERLLALAASLEDASEHPLARAITQGARARGVAITRVDGFHSEAGRGVHGTVRSVSNDAGEQLDNAAGKAAPGDPGGARGTRVTVGSPRYLERELGVDLTPLRPAIARLQQSGQTAVVVAIAATEGGASAIGALGVADTLKPDAREAVASLQRRGLHTVMITGDHPTTAQAIADELGLDEVHAEVLPDRKAATVRDLQADGVRVMFVGDGINDAPALTQADVGMAIGAGTDIAIESADIVLTGDRLTAITDALDIGRTSHRKTVQNLTLAFTFNGIGVPLAVTGLVQPAWAMLAMIASVTTVLANSFAGRFLTSRPRRHRTARRERETPHADAHPLGSNQDSGPPAAKHPSDATRSSERGTRGSTPARGGAHRATHEQDAVTARLHSPAVSCSGCVTTIGQRLAEIEGVDVVEGDATSRWITVRYRPNITELEAIENAMLEAGYPVDERQPNA